MRLFQKFHPHKKKKIKKKIHISEQIFPKWFQQRNKDEYFLEDNDLFLSFPGFGHISVKI